MTAAAILQGLEAHGATVRLEGERLILAAPPGAVPRDLIDQAKAHKPDLIALLSSRPSARRFHSRLLNEDFLVQEDSEPDPPNPDNLVIYSRSEMERMQGLPPDAITDIHFLKRHFGGVYTGRQGGTK